MPFGSAALGQGQAQVFGSPKDPLALYAAGQKAQAAQELQREKLANQQKKQQGEDLRKVLGYKYEDPGDRFRAWAADRVNQTNTEIFDLFQRHPNVDISQLTPLIDQVQGTTRKDIAYTKELNNIFDEKRKTVSAIKNVDRKAAEQILGGIVQKDSPYDVDRDKLENIEQIPAIYDLNGMVADSVADIKTQFRNVSLGDIQSSPLGLFMEVRDNKMRFKDIDKTMDFLLRGDDVTDLGIQQKINGGQIDDRIRWDIAARELAQQGGDPNNVDQVYDKFREIQYDSTYTPQVRKELRSILEQFNQEDRSVRVQSMGRFRQVGAKEQDYQRGKVVREEDLMALINPYEQGRLTEPKQRAQQALGKLRGGDFMGGKIVDAKLKRGGYVLTPEYTQQLSAIIQQNADKIPPGGQMNKEVLQAIEEAKNHLVPVKGNRDNVIFSIKGGTLQGEPETIPDLPLDLSQPEAIWILNAMMNQNSGERRYYNTDLFGQQTDTPYDLDLGDEEEEDVIDLTK